MSEGNARCARNWSPTIEIIEKITEMAAHGLTNEQIADALGIGESTLYFKKIDYPEIAEAIKKGKAQGIGTIANSLFQNALGGNVTAQIFFMKARAGWRDNSEEKDGSAEQLKEALNAVKELANKCMQQT